MDVYIVTSLVDPPLVHHPHPSVDELYAADLLLIHPDLQVAWRGDVLPEDVEALARRSTGHGR